MTKIFFVFLLSVISVTVINAQTAQSVYAELGGPGLASLNYDTRFTKSQSGIGGRVGVGGFSVDGIAAVFIPIGVNYLLGKDEKNYFEIGAGFTPVFGSDALKDDDDGNFSSSFGSLWIGYRLQPKTSGFTFRAGISPVFGNGFFIPYYAGLSFGYKF